MTYEQALKTIGRPWKRGRDIERDAALYWLGYHLRIRSGVGL